MNLTPQSRPKQRLDVSLKMVVKKVIQECFQQPQSFQTLPCRNGRSFLGILGRNVATATLSMRALSGSKLRRKGFITACFATMTIATTSVNNGSATGWPTGHGSMTE